MSETIGFVGVGTMGSRMTANLLEAGYNVVVFDVDPERVEAMIGLGAESADSPAELATKVDVVMSSLPTADAIESAYLGPDGLIEGVSDETLLIELSTTKPSTTETVSEALSETGATLVDAPVIGVPPVAERAELTIMVGGPQDAYERARPILEVLSETIYHVGGVGDGHRTKLINNALMLTNYAIAAEVLALSEVVGIDQDRMFEIIDSGMGGSDIVTAKWAKAFEEDFDPQDGSPIDNVRKDLTYALDMGYQSDFMMPITAAVEEHYTLASTVGRGGDDYSVLVRVLEDLATD